MPSVLPTNAAWLVLYGVLSLLKRTSRYGRNILPGPNSSSSASSRATIGSRTSASQTALWVAQNSLLLSASSPTYSSRARSENPWNDVMAP